MQDTSLRALPPEKVGTVEQLITAGMPLERAIGFMHLYCGECGMFSNEDVQFVATYVGLWRKELGYPKAVHLEQLRATVRLVRDLERSKTTLQILLGTIGVTNSREIVLDDTMTIKHFCAIADRIMEQCERVPV